MFAINRNASEPLAFIDLENSHDENTTVIAASVCARKIHCEPNRYKKF